MNRARKRGGQSFTCKFYPFLVVKVFFWKVRPGKWDVMGQVTQFTPSLKCPNSRMTSISQTGVRAWGPCDSGDNIMRQGVGRARGLVTVTVVGSTHAASQISEQVPGNDHRCQCLLIVQWSVLTGLETVGVNNGIICCYQAAPAHSLSHTGPWSLPCPRLWTVRRDIVTSDCGDK